MASVIVSTSAVKAVSVVHPLASLRPEEVTAARDIVAQHNTGKEIVWKIIAVKEPCKALVVEY
jgi:Cu2+-containing amine oxidase